MNNNNIPFKSNNIFLSIDEPQFKNVQEVREWLINGNSPNYINHTGYPAWWLAAYNNNEEGLDELLIAGADINIKTRDNINWVMASIYFNIPMWLFQSGFKNINIKWWEPDYYKRSPLFSDKLTKQMTNILCTYLWANFISWEDLKLDGIYPEEYHDEINPDIYQILLHWKNRLKFNKPIKYNNTIDKK